MRRRIAAAAVVCLAASVLAGTASVPGTAATHSAGTGSDPSTFSAGSLGPPTSLVAAPVGRDVSLTWGTGTGGSGYAVRGVANGTSDVCTGAAPAPIGTTAGTAFTDASRFAPQGTWFCYEVLTTFAGWTSVVANPRAAVRIGVVATAVVVTNAGSTAGCLATTFGVAGRLDCGDQVTVTFNQPIATASGPQAGNTVCANRSAGVITLAAIATTGACGSTEATTSRLGSLSGAAVTGADARHAATFAWSNGNRTMTVTVGARTAQTAATVSASARTLNPTAVATNLTSATGGFHTCDSNAGGGSCLPVSTSAF